jgi:hypothetical protein
LLIGTSALVGGLAGIDVASADASSSGSEPFSAGVTEVVTGPIQMIAPPNSMVLGQDVGSADVKFSPDTVFWRDGPVTLESFLLGEDVVAEGEWVGEVFSGSALIPVFYQVEGQVLSVKGETIETTAGTLRLTSFSRRQQGAELSPLMASDFAVGSNVAALTRKEPGNEELIVLSVY